MSSAQNTLVNQNVIIEFLNQEIQRCENLLNLSINDIEIKEIEHEINIMHKQLSNINVNNRNIKSTNNLTEIILNKQNEKLKKYKKFIDSTSIYGIICGPTQLGKTDAVREMIELCLYNNTPVIISSDNKTDQQNQLFHRIKNDLTGIDDTLIQVSDKNFEKCITKNIKNNKPFVIFCLDNSSQIEKIISVLASVNTRFNQALLKFKKFMIIHDEADVIQKDHDITTPNDNQAKSHQKWIELSNLFNHIIGAIDLKRVFVSATPENCCALYGVDTAHVIILEIPGSYIGYKNIEYNIFENDLEIKHILENQINRIHNDNTNKTGEIILYCVERNTDKGDHNQNDVLLTLSKTFTRITIHTYNSNGIIVYTTNQKLKELLNNISINTVTKTGKLKLKKYKSIILENEFIKINKEIQIRHFYTLCKKAKERIVITVGKDLINRGISYVSEDNLDPLCATTMIYRPGASMHAVGDNQTIGRITGLARPDLKRRLFTSSKIINTYKSYNKNQKDFLKEIIKNESKLTNEIFSTFEFKHKLKKNLDRPILAINKLNYITENVIGKIDGVKINSLKKWLEKEPTLLVSKMITVLYNIQIEINILDFKNKVEYTGSQFEFQHNIDNGLGISCTYGKLWIAKDNYNKIIMNPKIREFINNM